MGVSGVMMGRARGWRAECRWSAHPRVPLCKELWAVPASAAGASEMAVGLWPSCMSCSSDLLQQPMPAAVFILRVSLDSVAQGDVSPDPTLEVPV